VVLHPVKYIGAGLASGFVSGLLGVGGGVLMSSFLSATTDIPQATVVATSLLSVVPIGLAGTYHNYRYGNVQFKAAGLIGVCARPRHQNTANRACSARIHHDACAAGAAMGAVLATSSLVKDDKFSDRYNLPVLHEALPFLTMVSPCSLKTSLSGIPPISLSPLQHSAQDFCGRSPGFELEHVEKGLTNCELASNYTTEKHINLQ
jgi:F0F1-type ATP synthase membrane subunit c/vacuolar-type H+-ATPase subunit K